jgi:G:T/U-mismatch repair DNA glycosylase
MHWDGMSWTVVSSPNVGISNNQLRSVVGIAINDVWAVGFYSNTVTNPNQTLTMHWDGTSWTVVSSPNVGTSDNVLFSVAATSTNNVWAVGFYSNTVTPLAQTLTMHSDGTNWIIVPSPSVGTSDNQLRSVAAISPNDIWAVGVYSNTAKSAYQTLTMHWDGANWTVVPSPNVGTSDNVLFSVAANSANNVWAGGYYSNTVTPSQQTLTMHWDGTSWTVVSSPNVGTSDNVLFGVAAISASDVWAVGYYSNTITTADQTLTMHSDGTSWTIVPSPSVGTYGNQLRGVAATSANDVWAVGRYYSAQSISARTLVENSKCVNFFPIILKP